MYTKVTTSHMVPDKNRIRLHQETGSVRHRPSFTLLLTTLLLVFLGLVLLYSASSIYGLINEKTPNYFFFRQLISFVIGLSGMIFAMNVNYRRWYRMAPVFFLGGLLLLLFPLVYGHVANGATRWIRLGSFSLQPSELGIVTLIVYLSFLFARSWGTVRLKADYARALLVIGIAFVLILAEPDMGTAMMLLVPSIAIVFSAGIPMRSIFRLALLAVPLLVLAVGFASYRWQRVKTFLNPLSDPSGHGFQMLNSYYALADGGWLGRGLGHSIQKYLYLPEGHTDFIFAIVVEEIGVIGAFFILLLFGILVYKGFDIALRVKDPMGRFLAIGLTSMIGFAVFINIATVTGSLPATGIPLPFISYGGTSLVIKMWSVGVLLNISRYTDPKTAMNKY